jgi:hypothetical protein
MITSTGALADCTKLYEYYKQKLHNLERAYVKRDFMAIHKKIRRPFLRSHSDITKECKRGGKLLADIKYGQSYIKPLTVDYKRTLKKYGFNLHKKNMIYKVEYKKIKSSKLLTFIRSLDPLKNNPFRGLVRKNDPMYSIDRKQILPFVFEESRLINLLYEKRAKIFLTTGEVKTKKLLKDKQDNLNFLEEDVLIIQITE